MPTQRPDGLHHTREEILKIYEGIRTSMNKWSWQPCSVQQARAEKEKPAKPQTHIARTTFSVDRFDSSAVVRAFEDAIIDLKDGERKIKYDPIDIANVHVEWIAHRPGVAKDAPEYQGSAAEQYAAMMKDVKSDTVLLFTGGIAGIVNNAPGSRAFLTAVAQKTGGRCVNVKRRLAPQHPFPAPIIDIVLAFLSLVHPGPQDLHAPVSPSNIVFAGPSSGGTTTLSALQFLLYLRRCSISYNTLPPLLPAGVLALSFAGELQTAFPSWWKNIQTDVFTGNQIPSSIPGFPQCDIWPASPPRVFPQTHAEMLTHPLMAPSISLDWSGGPPVYIDIGNQERYLDSARLTVDMMRKSGVEVVYDEFELMAHDFLFFFPGWWQSRKLVERCAEMVLSFTGAANGGKKVESGRCLWTLEGEKKPLPLEMEVLDVRKARDLLFEVVSKMKPPTRKEEKAKI